MSLFTCLQDIPPPSTHTTSTERDLSCLDTEQIVPSNNSINYSGLLGTTKIPKGSGGRWI